MGIPPAAVLAGIIASACGRSVPPELLDGPAGLHGILEEWARASPMVGRIPSAREPQAKAARRFVRELERLDWGDPYGLGAEAARIRLWLARYTSDRPPPRQQAASAIAASLLEAFAEAEADPPSLRQIAAIVRELLGLLRIPAGNERPQQSRTKEHLETIRAVYRPGMTRAQLSRALQRVAPDSPVLRLVPRHLGRLLADVRDGLKIHGASCKTLQAGRWNFHPTIRSIVELG